MKLPIIFYHIGYQEYLRDCVEQASKKNTVILIGDQYNKHLGGIGNVEHLMYT